MFLAVERTGRRVLDAVSCEVETADDYNMGYYLREIAQRHDLSAVDILMRETTLSYSPPRVAEPEYVASEEVASEPADEDDVPF